MVAFAHLFIRGDHLVGLSLLLDISKVVFGLKYGGRFDPPQRMKPRWWQILLMNLLFLNMLILLHSVLSRFPDLSFANSAWRTRRLLCTNNVYINRARPLQVFLASGFTARQILALVFPLLRPTIRAKCFTLPSVKTSYSLDSFLQVHASAETRYFIFHSGLWMSLQVDAGSHATAPLLPLISLTTTNCRRRTNERNIERFHGNCHYGLSCPGQLLAVKTASKQLKN